MNPLVSVILPVYNCRPFVEEAVQSILDQTYPKFELIIIDDSSTDGTQKLLRRFKDPRILLIEKSNNTGLIESLNHGLNTARGKYIARMDGDDISHSVRFAKQVAFLEANPEVGMCGTLYQVIGTNYVSPHPTDHEELKVKLLTNCYVAHPTVMLRKSVLDLHCLRYDPEMESAEDYDLWSRLVFCTKIANLGEILLYYRIHEAQVSQRNKEKQKEVGRKVRLRLLQKLLPGIPDFTQGKSNFGFKYSELETAIRYLHKLSLSNKCLKVYNQKYFAVFIRGEKASLIKNFLHNSDEISVMIMTKILFKYPILYKYFGIQKSVVNLWECVRNYKFR